MPTPTHKVLYSIPTVVTDLPRPHTARVLFCWLRNSLALLSFLLISGGLLLYFKGYYATVQFDADFTPALTQFVQLALQEDAATALVKRFTLHTSQNLSDVAEQLAQHAQELGFPVQQRQQLNVQLIVFDFCVAETSQTWLAVQAAFALLSPCQLAVHQRADKQFEFLMINQALLVLGSRTLDPQVKAQLLIQQDQLLQLMTYAKTKFTE